MGADIEAMTTHQRIEYCKNDVSLVHGLISKLNDAGVFGILYELSKRTGLSTDQLANNRFLYFGNVSQHLYHHLETFLANSVVVLT